MKYSNIPENTAPLQNSKKTGKIFCLLLLLLLSIVTAILILFFSGTVSVKTTEIINPVLDINKTQKAIQLFQPTNICFCSEDESQVDTNNFSKSKIKTLSTDMSFFEKTKRRINGSFADIKCYVLGKTMYIISSSTSNISFPKDSSRMFEDCTTIENISFSNVDTSTATSMAGMFQGCTNLKSVELKGFNTDNVMDMSYMFADCHAAERIAFNFANCSSVVDMSHMYENCYNLQYVNIHRTGCKNVRNTEDMFRNTHILDEIISENQCSEKEATIIFLGLTDTKLNT